ncbi:MAG: hypothetical protein AAF652_15160 [Cyanobacteria bacterium P01_C01_bin.72]
MVISTPTEPKQPVDDGDFNPKGISLKDILHGLNRIAFMPSNFVAKRLLPSGTK